MPPVLLLPHLFFRYGSITPPSFCSIRSMAGVSLVADAAEELEHNTINSGILCNVDARTLTLSSERLPTVDGISTNHMKEADSQAPVKQKLQLFPINEATLKPLEKVDLLGSPIVRLADIETTTLGATYVARLAAGVWTKEQVFAGLHKENTTVFRPKLDEAHKKKRADSWYKAVSRSLDLADLSL